jgi:hypothetical protein
MVKDARDKPFQTETNDKQIAIGALRLICLYSFHNIRYQYVNMVYVGC